MNREDVIRWHWDRGMSVGMIAQIWEMRIGEVEAIVDAPEAEDDGDADPSGGGEPSRRRRSSTRQRPRPPAMRIRPGGGRAEPAEAICQRPECWLKPDAGEAYCRAHRLAAPRAAE